MSFNFSSKFDRYVVRGQISDFFRYVFIVRFLAWNSEIAYTSLEDWCMGWWKIEMIVHNSDTHILLSWTWPKHERFFKYHYSNWKFTHTKGDTTLLSKNAHWSKKFSLIKEKIVHLLHYFFFQKPDVRTSFLAMNINSAVCSVEWKTLGSTNKFHHL